jgi:glycosyltransferase involved in cell wall biosynthesis
MMSRSRVDLWYLIGTLAVGGAERTLVDLANNLDQDRFNVTIWTLAEPGPLASDVDSSVEIRSLNASSKGDVRVLFRFGCALRREQPDILQSFLFLDNTVARITGLANTTTTVVTGVRSVPDSPNMIRATTDRITLPLSDHIVSNSEAGAEFIVDRGANRQNVSVIHNGRDLDRYAEATAPLDLRQEIGISSTGPVVGTVGRLIERKGQFDLLEAWPDVLENHPGARLLIVGDGPARTELLRTADELGINESVHFLGTWDEVPELLDCMDLFVFPSHFEGLPGALLEAMAAGLPIVTTPVDGNSELVADEESGLYVPVKCPGALGNRMNRLLADRELARSLGAKAAHVARTDFTLDSMVSEFETLYMKLAKQ